MKMWKTEKGYENCYGDENNSVEYIRVIKWDER